VALSRYRIEAGATTTRRTACGRFRLARAGVPRQASARAVANRRRGWEPSFLPRAAVAPAAVHGVRTPPGTSRPTIPMDMPAESRSCRRAQARLAVVGSRRARAPRSCQRCQQWRLNPRALAQSGARRRGAAQRVPGQRVAASGRFASTCRPSVGARRVVLEGIRQGPSLRRLLGYPSSSARCTDRWALGAIDESHLRVAQEVPLAADRHPDTRSARQTPPETGRAKNVVDGLGWSIT